MATCKNIKSGGRGERPPGGGGIVHSSRPPQVPVAGGGSHRRGRSSSPYGIGQSFTEQYCSSNAGSEVYLRRRQSGVARGDFGRA